MKGYLASGETCFLRDIFHASHGKVVIPDLQRDYCWGGRENLVTDFIENIRQHFNEYRHRHAMPGKEEPRPLMMGIVYGYYEATSPHLQLCDGQQRLTTLYLLIGLINRACGDNRFQDFLMSGQEGDREPNLIYGIRDSSLYFLSDLVCSFFTQAGKQHEALPLCIKEQPWWFHTYEADPTIQSMISAMATLQNVIDGMDESDVPDFGEFVCRRLQFVFFDMGNRSNGEETFVLINTTGEPLTAAENLKPLMVTRSEAATWEEQSRKWEEIDHYFWLHRDREQETSDAGMKEFLRWAAGIFAVREKKYYSLFREDYAFPHEKITMDQLYDTYTALKELNQNTSYIQSCPLLSFPSHGPYNLQDYFIILPALSHYMHFHDKEATKRVYLFFQNIRRYTKISADGNNIVSALLAVETMKIHGDADICSLLDWKSNVHASILTEEENARLTVISAFRHDEEMRRHVEEAFEGISSHPVLSGRIFCLIAWSGGGSNFSLAKFCNYAEKFRQIFAKDRASDKIASDTTVLALAAFHQRKGYHGYPITHESYRDFCYSAEEWHNVIYDREHPENIVHFGEFLGEAGMIAGESAEEEAHDAAGGSSLLSPLMKGFPPQDLFGGLEHWGRRILIHEGSGIIRLLRNRAYRSDKDIYLLDAGEALPCRDDSGHWSGLRYYGDGDGYCCLYTDHLEYDIAMDIQFGAQVKGGAFQLRVFERGIPNKKKLPYAEKLFGNLPGSEEHGALYVSPAMPAGDMITLITRTKKEIQDMTESGTA